MAQTGYTPISIYYSATTSNVPTAGNLVAGELAINTADGKLFYKDSSGVVQVIGTKGGVGSSTTTQVLYNSSGLVVGSANMTFNGTTLTLANDAVISGLTVGKGNGAVATNTAIGAAAISATATGGYNTAVGSNSMSSLTSGQLNTAIGYGSSFALTTASQTVSVGQGALTRVTTGSDNTGLGFQSLTFVSTGTNNTGVGSQALWSNTTASRNTAVGYQAGYTTTTGSYNSVLGYQALYLNTTGERNTAVGEEALGVNTTGSYNTAVGMYALDSNTTSSYSVAFGYQAGVAATGGYGTYIGYNAGSNITSGNGGIYIGYGVQGSSASATNEMIIATSATSGKGSATAYIAPASAGGVYQSNNSTLWAITSDQRLKKNIVDNTQGLAKILPIQVRNFEYRLPEEITEVPKEQAIQKAGVQLGAIAQELQQVLPECVKQESTGIYTVDADPLIWYLINAIKELNAKIIALENK